MLCFAAQDLDFVYHFIYFRKGAENGLSSRLPFSAAMELNCITLLGTDTPLHNFGSAQEQLVEESISINTSLGQSIRGKGQEVYGEVSMIEQGHEV